MDPLEKHRQQLLGMLANAQKLPDIGKSLVYRLTREIREVEAMQATATSSAPTTGPVTRRSESHFVNRATLRRLLEVTITDFSSSTESMPGVLEATYRDSSTLQLTLRWPTQSGESKAGARGPVDLEASAPSASSESNSDPVVRWWHSQSHEAREAMTRTAATEGYNAAHESAKCFERLEGQRVGEPLNVCGLPKYHDGAHHDFLTGRLWPLTHETREEIDRMTGGEG